MKATLLSSAILMAGIAHADAAVFKAWMADCDNALTCTALGMPAEDGAPIGYVRVMRDAGPAGVASARVVVLSQGEEGTAEITVLIDGKAFGLPLKGSSDGAWARADLPAPQASAFIAAIANAGALTLQRTDETGGEAVDVPLDGSSAALRWIDAQQKRDGGVTALIAKGDKPAAAVPPAPDLPSVTARRMTDISDAATRPADPALADAEECGGMDLPPMAFDLGDGVTLWGTCVATGAYNFTFAFHLVDKAGKVTPVPPLPGDEGEWPALALTNPYVTEDMKTLSSFAKARGLGDCGDMQTWAWDGAALRLVERATLDRCRGVSPTEWIVTYRALFR